LRTKGIFLSARVPLTQIYLPQKLPCLSEKFPLLLGLKSLPELPPGALIAAIHPAISRKLPMPRPPKAKSAPKDSTANTGFEAKVGLAADKLGNTLEAAEPSGARQSDAGSPQGEGGGVHQFYTPSCVVSLLVEMLAPYKAGRYDPSCGSGGVFFNARGGAKRKAPAS